MRRRFRRPLVLSLALVLLVLAGCDSQRQAGDPVATHGASSGTGGPVTLKIAVLPVMDVLPLHVAAQNAYYDPTVLQVELVPVKSGQERDTLMQTGEVDGMLTDLLSPVLFNQHEQEIVVVRTARRVYPDSPLFRLLAKPGSGIQSPSELAGIKVGTAQNTVIAYITDRMLQKTGLSQDQIRMQEVAAIPVRFELLINGELEAATLPDPLASGAIAAGAISVMDDTSVPELSQSVLAFSSGSVRAKGEAIRHLLEAWERAATELNANPQQYRDLLITEGRVPESIQGTFQMPPFPGASVPTPEQMSDMVAWALDKGLIESRIPYERMVDSSYLP